jgi:hypothetical protein
LDACYGRVHVACRTEGATDTVGDGAAEATLSMRARRGDDESEHNECGGDKCAVAEHLLMEGGDTMSVLLNRLGVCTQRTEQSRNRTTTFFG